MLADLDDTLKQLLIREVPLDLSEVDVSFEAPDREWSGRLSRPTVNCFLYDVRENLELRQADWEVTYNGNGTASKRRPPLRINTTYQVTVWARAPEDEHRLLWRVLWALARNAQLPDPVLQGALREQPFPVQMKVAQPDTARANPADLWQAVDNRIRPSLTCVVTLALDPERVETSPLVFTKETRLRYIESRADLDGQTGKEAATALQIAGVVTDRRDSGRALAGVAVRLRETGAEVTTDAQGHFTFVRVPRGPITLVAHVRGRREVSRPLTVPAAHYDLEV